MTELEKRYRSSTIVDTMPRISMDDDSFEQQPRDSKYGESVSSVSSRTSISVGSHLSVFKQVPKYYSEAEFFNGSKYYGMWDTFGMNGVGTYEMPHGVVYEGLMSDGMFDGDGILRYPCGSSINGFWMNGRLIYPRYVFKDGLTYEEANWTYCQPPDRRFHSEIMHGLKTGGRIKITDEHPPRIIPAGCYDAGEGFYDPKTKCLLHVITGEVLRIPTPAEEEWIKTNCRKAWDENVPFKKEMTKNSESKAEHDARSTPQWSMYEGLPVTQDEQSSFSLTSQNVSSIGSLQKGLLKDFNHKQRCPPPPINKIFPNFFKGESEEKNVLDCTAQEKTKF